MKILIATAALLLCLHAGAQKAPVFLYAGQSNADGREFVQNLPDYMKVGTSPYNPYTHLQYASICGTPTAQTFGQRTLEVGTRYAFCDVANYWIDQATSKDFYAIKCAYGGTAIASGVTAEKLPIWYADSEWMKTHYAYKGDDLTQEAYKNYNSLTKNLTEGFASLVEGTLSKVSEGYDVKAIMWHQGESDRNAAASYYDNFKTMIAYMRQAIYDVTGDEKDLTLPFIFGTICHNSTQYNATVEKAQLQVAKDVPNVYYIDMSDVTLRSDNLHFDGPATEYLGKQMYNKLVELGLVDGKSIEAVKPRPDSNTDIEVEAEGLFFRANANRATIDPGKNIGLYSTGIYLIIPKVKPGQYITIEAVTANGSKERGITFDTMCEPYLDCIQGGTASYSRQKNVWWYRDTFTEPQNMTFCVINGGIFIYKVMVSDASPISTSGISPDTATPHPACLYTLSGLQASPSHKGIYICEGKKIVRKEWTK